MKIKVLGSSSKGNCYILSDEVTEIMIECGLTFNDIRKALNFQLPKDCIVSHSHMDHAKAHKELAKAGVNIYLSKETLSELNAGGHRYKTVEPLKTFKVGTLFITPLEMAHDVVCYGYQIQSDVTGEVLVFMTDTFYCKYKLKNVNYYFVECNYVDSILEQRKESGAISEGQYNRTKRSHMGLETLKNMFIQSDKERIQKIVLIHLSAGNSDSNRMIKEIKSIVDCDVFVADSNQEYNFGF